MEIRIRYNDQPNEGAKCTCGKDKKYFQCCGKFQKIKHKEIVITFLAEPDTIRYQLELLPEGVFVLADGKKAKILSSEIRTTYERAKAPKILNKIHLLESVALITPDNVFQYFNNIIAIDTNTNN